MEDLRDMLHYLKLFAMLALMVLGAATLLNELLKVLS